MQASLALVARSKLIVLGRSIFLCFVFTSLTKLYFVVVATSLFCHLGSI